MCKSKQQQTDSLCCVRFGVMAAVFGSISEFAFGSDDVTEWVERLEQWFVANTITENTRKRALLLSNIGARGYKLIS